MGRKSIASIRRDELATAAFEVLSLHGIQGTTLQRVAEHTGASKASVLHYFSTKQQLIETALRRANGALREEATRCMRLASTPWERFYAIIEANFSTTSFKQEVAQGWVSMCAEVPHNEQFQRIQTAIFRRMHSNYVATLKEAGIDEQKAEETAQTLELLIDGLWMRCGLQIGGLTRKEALDQVEVVIHQALGDSHDRRRARQRMHTLASISASVTNSLSEKSG